MRGVAVCGINFNEGELISVSSQTYNLWRHSNCLQLWFIKPLKIQEIVTVHSEYVLMEGIGQKLTDGCSKCGEKFYPRSLLQDQNQHMKINQNYEAVNE